MKKLTSFTQHIFIILIVLIILFLGKGWYHHSHLKGSGPDSDSYQAVFLDNGSAFYGKLEHVYSHYPILKDVYYLKANPPSIDPKTGTQVAPANPYNLVKFGEEIHSPEDVLHLSKKHILYWVNIKDTGNVSQAIKKYSLENISKVSEKKGVGIQEEGSL